MKKIASVICLLSILYLFQDCNPATPGRRILVFTRTMGYHHASIPDGVAAIKKLGEENDFTVDTTSDPDRFTDDGLKRYRAVVFLSTTGNILNSDQQVALERYIEAGGGFVGIHAAADAEYNWSWYNGLVGAYFKSHPLDPNIRRATIIVTDSANPAMKGIPHQWERSDEWYNYKNIRPDIKVLAMLDESSYEGGENGRFHPIAWYHAYDGGRAFYTGGGHTSESYNEPLFLQHIAAGIAYAMGPDSMRLDYSKSYAVKAPEENRFTKVVLSNDLNEPMELAVAPSGFVYFIERSGNFYAYNPNANSTKLVYRFPVLPDTKQAFGNGLLGLTIDPDFKNNHFIYFFYTPNQQPAHQNIARFRMAGDDSLDVASEKLILQVPIDMEVSAHTGGSLAWDRHKNLFISTGDNTVPFESDGYAPLDERPGRKTFDAQRSAANSNDLRGKILRIHPEADGSYTIPDGNLFPKGTPGTRPEIYVMGCRNPYRISVNQETSTLYWGEVGPDAGEDSRHGPRGYDEFNQAKKAGYYGWPYFVGNNKAYHDSDFATKEIGALFDTAAPSNASVNNTGIRRLPAATKAMIWYPYNVSDEFPELGEGGRTAMAGPVYHYNKAMAKPNSIPEYYDKALFVFDWMRNWVYAVRFDDQEQFVRMEAFMPLTGDFRRPIDMDITPEGVMYMLEYGSVYGADNDDARLVRIDYNGGNRAPVAKIGVSDSIGHAPLKVQFNGDESNDYDEDDQLTYRWVFGDDHSTSAEVSPVHTFKTNGVFPVVLTVSDPSGLRSADTAQVEVGNTAPELTILAKGNRSFYFTGIELPYSIQVRDQEDHSVDSSRLNVTLQIVPHDAGNWKPGATSSGVWTMPGRTVIVTSDCQACHRFDSTVVGPAFIEVSKKYATRPDQVSRLAAKIIAGGSGVWGNHYMNAHPQLSKQDAINAVKYILSLSTQKTVDHLPVEGSVRPDRSVINRTYVLNASYTDRGNGVLPLTGSAQLVLRPARIEAEDADLMHRIERGKDGLGSVNDGSYFVLKQVDLSGISGLAYRYASKDNAGVLEVHLDSAHGPVVSLLEYPATGDWEKFRETGTAVRNTEGQHDLYFVFRKDGEQDHDLCQLDWLEFKR